MLEPDALPESAMPRSQGVGDAFAREFDRRLGGRVSRLRDWSAGAERVVADAVRATFGLTTAEMDDVEPMDRVMNPARNPYRIDMLNVSHHSPLMRALNHPSYVFEKRLSHTADSQDQRHRMVPASRPMMTFADTIEPDVDHAPPDSSESGGQGGVRPGHRRCVGREEPAAGARCAARARALRAPQREGAAAGGVGVVPRAPAQVDAPHLFQRAGGDLPRVDGRDRAGAGGPPAAREVPRSAVRAS